MNGMKSNVIYKIEDNYLLVGVKLYFLLLKNNPTN